MTLDAANPFATRSPLPFGLPDFAAIVPQHYRDALDAGMPEHLAELDALAANPEPPTAENTLDAWERAGQLLTRALTTFYAVKWADSSDDLDAIDADYATKLAAHSDAIYLNPALYQRLAALRARADAREVTLDPEQSWLLDDLLATFTQNGVALVDADKARLQTINARLAELSTEFDRTNLAARNAGAITVTRDELDGLSPDDLVPLARPDGTFVIDLVNTSQHPLLEKLTNRDLRRRLYTASVTRGLGFPDSDGVPTPDTRAIIVEIARLRAERATLLGFPNHAALVVERACARTTDAVAAMLGRLAPAALDQARRDEVVLKGRFAELYPGVTFAPWDWAYTAEIVRRERFDLDLDALAPHLAVEKVLRAVYQAAERLYGITFTPRPDLRGHTVDAECFQVDNEDGSPLGLFVMDFWTRPTKQGGAWMNNIVEQSHLLGDLPVVTNNCNYARGATTLTWDDVITMFHEFGHALHGLLAASRYPSHSGANTPRDFVEFPSQVNEHWAWQPDVVIPAAWASTMQEAATFNQGFHNYETWSAMVLDQAWHTTPLAELPRGASDVEEFERKSLDAAGLSYDLIPPRYRTQYFAHSWGGYAAAYYSYVWAEVMDADAAAWFDANGGATRQNGEHFRRTALAPGGSVDVMSTWRSFIGRDPDLAPLLRRKGLDA